MGNALGGSITVAGAPKEVSISTSTARAEEETQTIPAEALGRGTTNCVPPEIDSIISGSDKRDESSVLTERQQQQQLQPQPQDAIGATAEIGAHFAWVRKLSARLLDGLDSAADHIESAIS